MKKFFKYFLYAIGGFFALIIIVAIFTPQDDGDNVAGENVEQSIENTKELTDEEKETIRQRDSAERTETALNHVRYVEKVLKDEESITSGDSYSIISNLKSMQSSYYRFADIIAEMPDGDKQVKQYQKDLSKLLAKYYQIARGRYVEEISDKLYPENIEVSSMNNDTYIVFTGSLFADNKNKLKIKDQLNEQGTIKDYRIQTLKFRWYSGDRGDSWSFTVPADDEIVQY